MIAEAAPPTTGFAADGKKDWYGHLQAEVTTRLCWRVATGHTVTATNSAVPRIRR